MSMNQHSMFSSGGRFLLRTVRQVLFLVLLYLRALVFVLLKWVGGLAGFCFAFSLLFLRGMGHDRVIWIFGGLSFGSFLIRYGYDAVLVRLAPHDSGLIL